MKIGINTFGCDPKSGLGSYLLYFIANIPQSDTNTYELFGPEMDRYTYTTDKDYNYISVNLGESEKKQRLWHKFKIKKFIKKNKYDVVLFPAAEKILPTKFKGFTGVAIINSIISEPVKGLNRIQKIVAATEFIRNKLIDLGIDQNKIIVVPNGIDHKAFYPMSELMDDVVDVKPFAIKRPYFIYGSSLAGPEKKHIELIKAFEIFKKNTGLPHRLVIAGNEGSYSQEIHKAAYNSEFASDIFLTGYFPHENFPKLNAGADACIFPSVNEGSGLPVIEALACGVPVICSNKGALPEVGGNVPLYFDSDNIDEIASKMQTIVENKTLRNKMISEGLVWAAVFNWETTVAQTIEFALR